MNFSEFKAAYQKSPVQHFPNQVGENPLVSVCVMTYQHASYIRDCLDGILMQETDFDFEILLGEDQSNDGTREICIEYATRYPDKIRLFLHSRENNIKVGGFASGKFNLLYNICNARGKYWAFCEGDDYWIDKHKLQKQVSFLEGNADFALSSHEAYYMLMNEKKTLRAFFGIFYNNLKIGGIKDVSVLLNDIVRDKKAFWGKRRDLSASKRRTVADFQFLVSNPVFIPMHSVIIRKDTIPEIPFAITEFMGAHQFLILLAALKGKNYHFRDIMGVKRDQITSITQNPRRKEFLKYEYVRGKEIMFKCLKSFASPQQQSYIDTTMSELFRKEAMRSKARGEEERYNEFIKKSELSRASEVQF